MEDVLTETPPPSRFFDEDLDNFAAASPSPLPPILLLNPNPKISIFIIAISAPSLTLVHRIPNKTLIGTLILPEIPLAGNPLRPSPLDVSCRIYAAGGATIAAVQIPVAAARSRTVARSLLSSIRAERVLILDSIRGQNYRGGLALSRDEAFAFKLETSEERREGAPAVRGVEYLPTGSVMDGLGAAVLADCQMRGEKGTLLAMWPESGRPSPVPLLRSVLRGVGIDVGGEFDGEAGDGFEVRASFDSGLYT